MRKMLPAVLVAALLCVASGLEAQGSARPFISYEDQTRSLTKEEAAFAFGNNVRSIITTDCATIAASAERMVGIPMASCADLAAEIERAEVRPCPTGLHYFANVLQDGSIGRVDTPRHCRPGETFLYRDNRPFMSLQCGNWVLGGGATPRRVAQEPLGWVPPPSIPDSSTRAEAIARVHVNLGDLLSEDEPSWLERNWEWVVGVPLVGGAIWGGLCYFADIGCIGGDVNQTTIVRVNAH